MYNLKEIILCARVNFKKWKITPKMYVILTIIIIFEYYTFSGVSKIAAFYGVNSSPWVFPFFLTNPNMFIILGSLTILLYCNAPFADKHAPFLAIRTGRKSWIMGQLFYIYISSFVYTTCFFLISILMLLPRVQFTNEWGSVLHTISKSYWEVMGQTGASITFMPHEYILAKFTPIQATVLAFVLFWLVTAFIGILIICFNILFGKMSGIIAAGILTCISYFSVFFGTISIGVWLYYISPINWSSIAFLDLDNIGKIPSPTYAIICLVISIILMSIISVIGYCRKDLEILKGEF